SPALHQPRARPRRKRRLGRGDGPLRIIGGGPGIDADHLVGVRGIDVVDPLAIHPLAIDEVLVQFGHDRFLSLGGSAPSSRYMAFSPPREKSFAPAEAGGG